jgi:hypothetical protein
MLAELRTYYEKLVEIVESNQARAIAFHGFLNEDGTEVTAIQVHPNAASMEYHMQVIGENYQEHLSRFPEMLEGTTIDYYGDPPESALEMNKINRQVISINPAHVDGFTHSSKG